MAKFNCVLLFVVAVACGMVSAITEEEKNTVRAAAIPVLRSCGMEHGVSAEALLAAKAAKNPDAINSCFYACFFKNTNAMNDQGLFDVASAQEGYKKYINGAEDLNKLQEISNACASVNDQAVSDGAKGCDRAKLLLRCFIEHKNFTPFDD